MKFIEQIKNIRQKIKSFQDKQRIKTLASEEKKTLNLQEKANYAEKLNNQLKKQETAQKKISELQKRQQKMSSLKRGEFKKGKKEPMQNFFKVQNIFDEQKKDDVPFFMK